ncbi:LysR family transcriptional regulator [Pseudomonas sp. S75]|uniref:LysR family transcriptional regulator n=1 Tax=unclassified Pseudomonas TaxID=196821 RepID=UPI001903DF1F|nr:MULTISPECIES: LysR family transcriptional regulator [unclassified Pseudomonas]MBJ9974208.1 LysR family transcriptional regulator [Pseudomonas sp. S30]MBK0151862.1 LysR family transcriptional regulator [Pseudomonas sp. S75]
MKDKNHRISDRLDWNLLRTFLVIAREKSISSAAVKLHVTQSAVSQALRRLEDQFGRRLIERHHSRFYLTAAGEEVLAAADTIYGNVAQLASNVSDAEEQTVGRINVLVASRIHSAVYDAFWAKFHKAHPRIEVELEVMPSSEIVKIIQQKGATAGIALCKQIPKRLEHKIFLQQNYGLFCGQYHDLYGKSDLTMEDLLGENFVSFTSDALGDSLSPLTIFRDQRGFSGTVVASSSQYDEVKRLLVAGFGIGCLPEHSVQADLEEGRLWRLPPDEGVCTANLYFLWHEDAQRTAAERTFLDAFKAHIETYPLPHRLLATIPAISVE